MRVIPVIDLRHGATVHAVRGDRERYRPVQSVLAGAPDPVRVVRAFRAALDLDELYVADLDALAGGRMQSALIARLARESRLMVDAATSTPDQAEALLALGAERVVAGTETLGARAALDRLVAKLPPERLVVSLDLRAGRVLSRDRALAGLSPADGLARLARAGVREAIVLDLDRVGSGLGPGARRLGELAARFGDLQLLAGGGVRDLDDLLELQRAGAAGALVASALHDGSIGADDLRALRV